MKKTLAIAALVLSAPALAQFSSLGDLTNGMTPSGSFPTGTTGGQNLPATWDLWTFDANAGDFITVSVARTAAALDPIAAVFFGNANGLAIPAAPLFIGNGPAVSGAIGLPFVALGDDNVDDAFGGPFGDPLFSFNAANSGTYSVFVASFASLTVGVQEYDITITGSTVPTPGALALLGVGGLAAMRRRR